MAPSELETRNSKLAARRILHVDMDAFFAAIEQRDDPALRGKPVAVGGAGKRGVVAAASYEARPFGVHSAMPSVVARRRCPELIFVSGRFEVYREVSRQVRAIFRRYTDLVEPASLDEAYLDVTQPKAGPASGTLIAEAIRRAIYEETGLTASAGVSYCKFLAKQGSGHRKPDGLTVIPPGEALAFIRALPVERFHGVGPKTAERLHALGLRTGEDLQGTSEEYLVHHLGERRGAWLHALAHGRDDRPVRTHRQRKSVGAERTYRDDLRTAGEHAEALRDLAQRVAERLEKHGVLATTVVLKVRYNTFETFTRQVPLPTPTREAGVLCETARRLLALHPPARPLRLLGITTSGLVTPEACVGRQLVLSL